MRIEPNASVAVMAAHDVPWWIVGVVVLGLVLALACSGWNDRRQYARRRRLLQERPILTVDEWIRIHVTPGDLDPGATLAVCEALATALRCHVTQVRPDDRFGSGHLKPIGWFLIWEDDELDEFADVLLPRAIGRAPRDDEYEPLCSVADLARWAHRVRLEQQSGAVP